MTQIRLNLKGSKFGRLKVIQYVGRNKSGGAQWLCQCDCGNKKIINGGDLRSGNTKSCGCLRIRHGHAVNANTSQAYTAWSHMKQRCLNIRDKSYKSYGGRGIGVCRRWLIFANFLKDMGEPPTNKHSLDRIDNNNCYFQKNCRWTTREYQQGNMRSNHIITFNNKTQCLAAWSRETRINQKTLWRRIVSFNWSIEKALTIPTRKKVRNKN